MCFLFPLFFHVCGDKSALTHAGHDKKVSVAVENTPARYHAQNRAVLSKPWSPSDVLTEMFRRPVLYLVCPMCRLD